ncbi:MAG: hypothetical protein JST14_00155 [Bacteroidetes bacterium]|nr:hypothetical protein [Bacteroidota bacterium]
MKRNKIFYSVLLTVLMLGSCKQEVITLEPPSTVTPPTPSKGNADFTKFIAIGNSFVAGMQAQALYNDAQSNSLARIMAKQFEQVGGATSFNQPDIGSVNGFNPISSKPCAGLILGRLFLFDPDGSGPRTPAPAAAKAPAVTTTCPSTVTTPASPAPFNTADMPGAYTGDKSKLNNFAVPLIYLAQALTPATGGPNPGCVTCPTPNPNPAFTPYYQRFASNPSANGTTGSTILGDALGAAGSFYLIWLGFDDVLLYAATGADGQSCGTYPMTSSSTFSAQFSFAINTMLTTNTAFKGVVGNIPDFTSLPYFYTVTWNAITLDAATAATVTTSLANNYNAFLDGMVQAGVITSSERDLRKLSYNAGKNGILMTDEGLTDLSPYMAGPYAGLLPYAKARQSNSTDLVPLAAGSILGTCFAGPTAVYGVSYPVGDQYILTSTETVAILSRTAEFNSAIANAVAASNGRLALADVRKAYNDLLTNKAYVSDGVMITPSFAPPTGAFSEDGIHPNSRGYAYTANVFISAINSTFSAAIPKASLAAYSATALPANP